jgi:calcium-binding protein CML
MEKKEEEFKEFERQFINIAGNLQTSIDINMLGLLTRNLGQNYRPEELERLMEEVDEDGNGKIEFKEFMMAMENKSREDEYTIKQAFAILDRRDSGYITPSDLRHAMICLGENYSLEEVTEMLTLVDEDQDGVINFQEFNKLVKKLR